MDRFADPASGPYSMLARARKARRLLSVGLSC